MTATNALVGSTPLAWVNVATEKLVRLRDDVVTGADTVIGGSATAVVTAALLLPVPGSLVLLVTDDVTVRFPSSVDWAVTVTVAVPPLATVPREKVTTLPDRENDPWLVVAEP